MPSSLHEILVELFRASAKLAAELLRSCSAIDVSELRGEVVSADLSQAAPMEARADCATVFRGSSGAAALVVIVEVQLSIDAGKRRTWPLYVTAASARYDCPALLLVFAPQASVARWARRSIDTGHPGFRLRPIVVSYDDVPRVSQAEHARRHPELAVLSALAHRTQEIASAALVGAETFLEEDRLRLYFDIVMQALPASARRELEDEMQNYEFQSDFARKYIALGRQEGVALGRQEGVALGRQEGVALGREEGVALGRQEGVALGRQEGVALGRAQLQAAALQLARHKMERLQPGEEALICSLVEPASLAALIVELGLAATPAAARASIAAAAERSGGEHASVR